MKSFDIYKNVILKNMDGEPALNGAHGWIAGHSGFADLYIVMLVDILTHDNSPALLVHATNMDDREGSTIPSAPIEFPDIHKHLPKKQPDPKTFWYDEWHDYLYPKDVNPVVGKCSRCGRDIRQLDWYSCAHSGCPSKATWISAQ